MIEKQTTICMTNPDLLAQVLLKIYDNGIKGSGYVSSGAEYYTFLAAQEWAQRNTYRLPAEIAWIASVMQDEMSFWKIMHRRSRHGHGDSPYKLDWLEKHPGGVVVDSSDSSSMTSFLQFLEHWWDDMPYARYEAACTCQDVLEENSLPLDLELFVEKLSQEAWSGDEAQV